MDQAGTPPWELHRVLRAPVVCLLSFSRLLTCSFSFNLVSSITPRFRTGLGAATVLGF